MTVKELYAELDRKIPAELSCEWDNDGLMCCPDGARQVGRVLLVLDVTWDAVQKAVDEKFDCIISHHPFIFKGLKSINEGNGLSDKVLMLVRQGISVMSFHTRLDAVEGGVNDVLCSLLGLENVQPVYDGASPLGRVGTLKTAISPLELAKKLKNALGAPMVLLSDVGKMSQKIAVVGGSGKDFIESVRATGADTYISGRLDYHPMTEAREKSEGRMNLLEAGHFYTEQPVCAVLADMIYGIDSSIECEIFSSNIIEAV